MATNVPAVMLLMEDTASVGGNRRFFSGAGWVDGAIPQPPMTTSQRALLNVAIAAGTVVTKSDAAALITSSAATAGCSLAQAWQYLSNPAAPAA